MTKDNEPPILPFDSPGSSVSSRLQDEYNEIIRNAVVLPTGDFQIRSANQQNAMIFEKPKFTENDSFNENLIDLQSPRNETSFETVVERRENDFYSSRFHSSFSSPVRRSRNVDNQENTALFLSNFETAPINDKMDNWYLDLKKNLMTEFDQIKEKYLEEVQNATIEEKRTQAEEYRRLNDDIKTMRQMLIQYEQLIEKKEQTEENLCKAVDLLYGKIKAFRLFYQWRLKMFEEQQEKYALSLAKRFYEEKLKRKTLNNWKISSEREWKKRFEQACEDKSKAILESLLNDYEAKFRDFESKIRAANEEIVRLRSEKSDRDQVIKKAFMRGVCALNVEAMSVLLKDKASIFDDEHFSNESETVGESLSLTSVSATSDEDFRRRCRFPIDNVYQEKPSRVRSSSRRRFASKANPILVQRHFPVSRIR